MDASTLFRPMLNGKEMTVQDVLAAHGPIQKSSLQAQDKEPLVEVPTGPAPANVQAAYERVLAAGGAAANAKMRRILSDIEQILGDDETSKIVIFSQFPAFVDLMERELKARKKDVVRIAGNTPAAKRAEILQDFQFGQTSIFLLSLRTGASGLNLTGKEIE